MGKVKEGGCSSKAAVIEQRIQGELGYEQATLSRRSSLRELPAFTEGLCVCIAGGGDPQNTHRLRHPSKLFHNARGPLQGQSHWECAKRWVRRASEVAQQPRVLQPSVKTGVLSQDPGGGWEERTGP